MAKNKGKAKLVVMIPAWDEEKTISAVVKNIPRKIAGLGQVKVLVVDDGSTDKTAVVAKKAGADKVVSHSCNRGLGVAFMTGIEAALSMGADIVVNIDADGQFNARDIPKLIEPLMRGEADVVTCTRFLKKEFEPKMPWVKKFGNSFFTKLLNMLTGKQFTDTQCGFRAYSREAALKMNLFGKFTYTQEVLLDLIYKGMRVSEVPLRVKGERDGQSRVVKSWYSYGVKAMIIILRALRDHKPLKFFGGIGLGMFLLGTVSAFILWVRLLALHKIDPFMWVVYADVILMILGFLLIMLGLIADMLDRQRKIQEQIIYEMKKQKYK